MKRMRWLPILLSGMATLALSASAWSAAPKFEEARLFIEYNSTDNDLGFHVFLDAEDWKSVKIVNPLGAVIFEATGKGPYGRPGLGLSELFFEGSEPSLDDVPLEDLLGRFPEGNYQFIGTTASGAVLKATSKFKHAIPAGPLVHTEIVGDDIVIHWQPVTAPPPGFPNERITIVGYQVIVEPFQVTLPPSTCDASGCQVTLPKEFAASLPAGSHGYEVLAIDASGNQTITADSFDTP
jgi:hypothetical protein